MQVKLDAARGEQQRSPTQTHIINNSLALSNPIWLEKEK